MIVGDVIYKIKYQQRRGIFLFALQLNLGVAYLPPKLQGNLVL